MRSFLIACCLLAASLWLVPASVDASDATQRAELLEHSLQAVEWYTNESVRKALQAEQEGDFNNAELFGNKAIESDLKAQGLRQETADAWLAAGKPSRAQAAWQRAASMGAERASMLAKRVPPLLRQWQLADGSGNAAGEREHAILYFQAVFLTAEQWSLVATFAAAAGDNRGQQNALKQLQVLLQALQRHRRLDDLVGDERLARIPESLPRWREQVAAAQR